VVELGEKKVWMVEETLEARKGMKGAILPKEKRVHNS
jgi:hypothetical protein